MIKHCLIISDIQYDIYNIILRTTKPFLPNFSKKIEFNEKEKYPLVREYENITINFIDKYKYKEIHQKKLMWSENYLFILNSDSLHNKEKSNDFQLVIKSILTINPQAYIQCIVFNSDESLLKTYPPPPICNIFYK